MLSLPAAVTVAGGCVVPVGARRRVAPPPGAGTRYQMAEREHKSLPLSAARFVEIAIDDGAPLEQQ